MEHDVVISAPPVRVGPPRIARATEIVEFVHRWYRFGGGSAGDIFVQFGVTADVFFKRALRLLRDEDQPRYSLSTLAAMRQVCENRLGTND